jgi:hypothetical protein
MPEQHAVLSASGAHRWIMCTPSARFEQEFEDNTSEAAKEGTAAHALAEYKLKRALKMRAKKPISEYDCEEMDDCTDGYVAYVLEQYENAKSDCTSPTVLIEQRLDFSQYVPDGFGTGDAVIVADKTLNIIDFKYGRGVLVSAVENPQMMLYAIGAITMLGMLYKIDDVKMHIYQPRRENISTFSMTVNDLLDWAENVLKPKAEQAFKGEGEFCSGEWCRFCKGANRCRARADKYLEMAKYDFALPPTLTDDDIECILPIVADLSTWANSIMAYAESTAINDGKHWDGYKVVEGRSNRKYSNEEDVVKAAKEAGYTDIYKKSLIPLTEMEKLMGKDDFKKFISPFVIKPQGKLTLVPESDKRKAVDISTAEQDFKN